MARLTSAWTDRHLTVLCGLLAAAVSGGLAVLARSPYDLLGLALVGLTIVVALRLDAFGGIVTGFCAAAALIAARRLGGRWDEDDFLLALALTGALVALGWLVGAVATSLGERAAGPGPAAAAPVFGSLGLLPADLALARLDEEVTRAQRHRRPLTVVLLHTDITDESLSLSARTAVWRTVGRLVESLVPETAVPFALAPDQVGAVLPEVDEAAAWELLGPLIDAAGRASFTVRELDQRRSLVDCAEVHAGLVGLSPSHPDADQLLAAVRQVAVADRQPASPPLHEVPGT